MKTVPLGRARRIFAALFAGAVGTILALAAGERFGIVPPLVYGAVCLLIYLHASLLAALLLGAAAAGDDGRPLWRRGLEAGLLLAVFHASLQLAAEATILGGVVEGYLGALFKNEETRASVRLFDLSGWMIVFLFAWSLTFGRLCGRPWLGALLSMPAALFTFICLAVPAAAFENCLYYDGEVMRGTAGVISLWCLLAALKDREAGGERRRWAWAGWPALALAVCAAVPVQAVMQVDSMLFIASSFAPARGDYWRALNSRSPGVRANGGALWSARGGAYRVSEAGGELTRLEEGLEGSAFGLLTMPGPVPMEALWDDAGRLWTLRSSPSRRETVVSVYRKASVSRTVYEDDLAYWGLSLRGGEAGLFRSTGTATSLCSLDPAAASAGPCEALPGLENFEDRLTGGYRSAGLVARIHGKTLRRENGGGEWILPGAGLKAKDGLPYIVALRLRDRDLFAVPISVAGTGAVALCEPDKRVRVAWPGAFDPKADFPRFDTLPDGTMAADAAGALLIMDPDGRWLPAVDLKPALASLGYPARRIPWLSLMRYADGKLWVQVDGAFVLVVDERGGRTFRVDRLPHEGVLMYQTRADAVILQTTRGAWRYDWDGRLTRLRRPS